MIGLFGHEEITFILLQYFFFFVFFSFHTFLIVELETVVA